MSSTKPPLWADLILTVWLIALGVSFGGAVFIPALAASPLPPAAYALMLLISALVVARRVLHRTPPGEG